MRIGDRPIDLDHPPYVIAEIGVNHDGSTQRAFDLVDAAVRAEADAIKLQFFRARQLLSRAARLATYQREAGASDPLEMLEKLELDAAAMAAVVEHAHAAGLHAIVSIFTAELVAEAERIPFDAYKTASTDIINRPLLERLIATDKPLLASTGAASSDEVREAVAWIGDHPHLLLHCVSSYPTADDDAALGGRLALLGLDPFALGYSDHTASLDTGALAVAGGACLLEKHLTMDRTAAGPDHAASLDAAGLGEYVRLVHRAWRMRGSLDKVVSDVEHDVRTVSRQSLTTTRALPRGHVLRRDDLTVKRPGTGLSPARLAEVEGRPLALDIEADMPLTAEHLV